MSNSSAKPGFRAWPWIATVLLLGGMAIEGAFHPTAADAKPYHRQVQEAALLAPLRIGPWTGQEDEIAREAIELLQPNVILQRRFRAAGREIGFVIVQCASARDLSGHYPPVCYPAHGAPMLGERTADFDLTLDRLEVWGRRYLFQPSFRPGELKTVYNFMILPAAVGQAGSVERDMPPVTRRAWDHRRRHFGAAQVQVVFDDSSFDEKSQLELVRLFVQAHQELLLVIRDGVSPAL